MCEIRYVYGLFISSVFYIVDSVQKVANVTLKKSSCNARRLTLKVPEKLQLYGLYVYYVVHICDFGMLRVNASLTIHAHHQMNGNSCNSS